MNILQRIIVILVALFILVGGLAAIYFPTFTGIQYLSYMLIILIAAGFFYFGFSSPNTKKGMLNRRSTDDGQAQTNTQQEVPIYTGKDHLENRRKLQNLINLTNKRLFKMSSVFPFDLFPNDVIIDQKQVLIVTRYFFFARRDFPVLIKNILVPIVETNLFFASFSMELVGYEQNPIPVSFLKKDEALRAKTIIMGLIVCNKEGIDLSKIPADQVLSRVEEIGKVRGE